MLVLVKMLLPHFLRKLLLFIKLPPSCIAIKNCIWTLGERRRSEFEIEGPFSSRHLDLVQERGWPLLYIDTHLQVTGTPPHV
jgi:hypothetical protein